jgi:hypothetical protein
VTILIELHYLPSLPYFSSVHRANKIIVEKHEHFVKQSFRNRCHILTAQGVERLVVPLTSKHGKVLITDIRIDYSQKWLTNHWRTLESAYRNAPFFEHYADQVQQVLQKGHVFLYDLNMELLTICLKWLKSDISIEESITYEKIPAKGIIDMRNVILAKKPERYTDYYQPVPYPQVFGNKFAEGLSLIDLVFCEGPAARTVVASSAKLP